MAFAGGRQRDFQKFKDFRRKYPKQDVSFLNREQRNERICETPEQLRRFLKGLLSFADKAQAEKRQMYCVLDTEGDCVLPGTPNRQPEPHYWHKYNLREQGFSQAEIEQRAKSQADLAAEYAAIKSSKSRQSRRPQFRQNSKAYGLLQTDVFAFQMASVDDESDEYSFAANPIKIMKNSGGKGMPPELGQLLQHEAVVWTNVSVKDDIQKMSDCFFNDNLCVKMVEAREIVEMQFGQPLPRYPDVNGCGALGLFELVFRDENLTWFKSPLCTRNHWWGEWGDGMIHYALMDVVSIAMLMRKIFRKIAQADIRPAPFVTDSVPRTLPTVNLHPKAKGTCSQWAFKDSDDEENDIFMWSTPAEREAYTSANPCVSANLPVVDPPIADSCASANLPVAVPPVANPCASTNPSPAYLQIRPPSPSFDEMIQEVNEMMDERSSVEALEEITLSEVEADSDSYPYEVIVLSSGDESEDVEMLEPIDDDKTEVDVAQVEASGSGIRPIVVEDEERVEDIRDTLLEVLPDISDDEVTGTFGDPVPSVGPGFLGNRVPVAPVLPALANSEWEVCFVATSDSEFLGEVALDKLVKHVTSVILNSRAINLQLLSRHIPSKQAPIILARAVCAVTHRTTRARANANRILAFFSSIWTESEKCLFFDQTVESEFFPPCRLIELLRITSFDLPTIVATNHDLTIACLRLNPAVVPAFMDTLSMMHQLPSDEKLDIFKHSRGFSNARAKFYMGASTDSNIVGMANSVSKAFNVEKPVSFRRKFFQEWFSDIDTKVSQGSLTVPAAMQKINEIVGYEAGERDVAIALLEPYEVFHSYFRKVWFDENVTIGTPKAPPCLHDDFHSVQPHVIRVLTMDMATQAASALMGAGRITVNFRARNDYRYNLEDVGAVGFSAAHLDVVFIFFPLSYPLPAAAFAHIVGQTALYCADVNRMRAVFGPGINFVQIEGVVCSRKGYLSKPVSALVSKAGAKLCRYGYHDNFGSPNVASVALCHFAAELLFLSKCV